jgi:4-amino-4-deoxy-L-arabinose transferase-like glycosyltransferase
LFAFIAERLFGRAAAIVGGAALLLTPVFSLALLQPNVDVVELAFLLAAVAAALQAAESRRRGWAFASGIGLALAALTRETSFVFVAVAAAWFLFMRQADKRLFAWAAPGFALPVLAEMLVYWAATGDALRRLHLSFGHTRLPSTELSAAVDTSRSPFFNPDFIAGWRPANGIDVHWTVDPLLNLFTHPQTGLTLLAGILLLCVYGGKGILPAPQARWAKLFMASAGAAAFLLIYALAIDPKPRMFVPLAAASALAIGAVAPHLWAAKSRLLLVVASIVVGGQSLLVLAAAPAVRGAESVAANWIAGAAPRTMTLSPNTSSHLALVPSARSLPVDAPGLFELHLSFGGCAAEADGRAVLRSWSFLDGEPALTALARRYLPMQASAERYFLCLYAPR